MKGLRGFFRNVAAVWMSVGMVVFVLAAIEIVPNAHHAWKAVLRVFDPDGGKADWRAAAEVYADAPWAKAYWREYYSSTVDWSPYVLWRSRPMDGTYVGVGADGNRKTWSRPEGTAPDAAKVWMFGGSTMFGQGARDAHTIASEAARRLGGDGRVAVTNFGQPGWVMTQSAIMLMEELKKGRVPDVVVFYDGVNDVFATMIQGTPGWPQNNANRSREFNLTNPERRLDLVAEAVMGLLPRTMYGVRKITGGLHDWPKVEDDEFTRRARVNADYMAATAEQVRSLGRTYGFKTLFVLQPVLFTKAAKTPHEQKAATDFIHLARPYAEAYGALRDHAAFRGRGDFLDLSGLFDQAVAPVYADYCHLGEAGNAAVAQAVSGAVAPLLRR